MAVEKSYRPVTLADFKGQEKTKRLLEIYIKAAKMKNEQLDHVLISGPSGTGKTTLAHIIGNELEKEIKVYSAPTIKKVDELVDILSSVDSGTVLFIDEVHRLNNKLSEALFLAMETFTVNSNLEGNLSAKGEGISLYSLNKSNESSTISKVLYDTYPTVKTDFTYKFKESDDISEIGVKVDATIINSEQEEFSKIKIDSSSFYFSVLGVAK